MLKCSLMLVMLLSSFSLVGCETIGGAGRDIEKAGEAVSRAAN